MTFGTPDPVAIGFFAVFIAITLGITYWAARRTQTADHFYAAGRSVTTGQNGFALNRGAVHQRRHRRVADRDQLVLEVGDPASGRRRKYATG